MSSMCWHSSHRGSKMYVCIWILWQMCNTTELLLWHRHFPGSAPIWSVPWLWSMIVAHIDVYPPFQDENSIILFSGFFFLLLFLWCVKDSTASYSVEIKLYNIFFSQLLYLFLKQFVTHPPHLAAEKPGFSVKALEGAGDWITVLA